MLLSQVIFFLFFFKAIPFLRIKMLTDSTWHIPRITKYYVEHCELTYATRLGYGTDDARPSPPMRL